eukprot:gnl/TRDRNA2_/TRDRNA2_177501_c0_seq1.p1 gnl/TRDRNA2_/TRDRNA2_177501_c0~~gnl/TRDRNA2_/TRDRNA2_177501_c0_seq1.p1  ORF type:complete len:206 (+),score=37.82 gnl/TRDRNA2_/TRDRNA2_177501_c0_seq1:65-619(+)
MDYSGVEVPSNSRRVDRIAVPVALFIGLCCGGLYALNNQQQLASADPAAALTMIQQKFLQPSQKTMGFMNGCPIAVGRNLPVVIARDGAVKLGSDTGGLVFVPDSVTIKAGESVQFTNNAGFPHNIVFDEDNVPEGVNAESLSREDYLNAPGETYKVKFDKAGEYGYYCEPHQGAGMKGKIVVQ